MNRSPSGIGLYRQSDPIGVGAGGRFRTETEGPCLCGALYHRSDSNESSDYIAIFLSLIPSFKG